MIARGDSIVDRGESCDEGSGRTDDGCNSKSIKKKTMTQKTKKKCTTSGGRGICDFQTQRVAGGPVMVYSSPMVSTIAAKSFSAAGDGGRAWNNGYFYGDSTDDAINKADVKNEDGTINWAKVLSLAATVGISVAAIVDSLKKKGKVPATTSSTAPNVPGQPIIIQTGGNKPPNTDSGLSTGAIVAMVAGSAVVVGALIYFIAFRKK